MNRQLLLGLTIVTGIILTSLGAYAYRPAPRGRPVAPPRTPGNTAEAAPVGEVPRLESENGDGKGGAAFDDCPSCGACCIDIPVPCSCDQDVDEQTCGLMGGTWFGLGTHCFTINCDCNNNDICDQGEIEADPALDTNPTGDPITTLLDECEFGACCDLSIGACQDGIRFDNCSYPLKFRPGTLCSELSPLCGTGACCDRESGICQENGLPKNCAAPLEFIPGGAMFRREAPVWNRSLLSAGRHMCQRCHPSGLLGTIGVYDIGFLFRAGSAMSGTRLRPVPIVRRRLPISSGEWADF